jgi:hypothetical protein
VVRVVIAPHGGIAAATWTAMHDEYGLASWISTLLDIERVTATDRQAVFAIGADWRIEIKPVSDGHSTPLSTTPSIRRAAVASRPTA